MPKDLDMGAACGQSAGALERAWRAALTAAGLPYTPVAAPQQTVPPDLFDQQLWVWGKDIYAEDGNALIRYGLDRCGCPDSEQGGTQYRLTAEDVEVRLWGFGLYWAPSGSPTGVLLRRYTAGPTVLPAQRMPDHVWKAGQLPTALGITPETASWALGLVADACTWIAGYERWAWATLGARHRRTVIAGWHKPRVVPAGRMAATWTRLARALRQAVPVSGPAPFEVWGVPAPDR